MTEFVLNIALLVLIVLLIAALASLIIDTWTGR